MKVLYFVSTLERCGPVNVIYNIINNMDRENFEPIIVTFSEEKVNSRKEEFEALDVKVFTLDIDGMMGAFTKKKYIRSVLAELDPDVIHSHGIRADIFSAVYLSNYYTVSTIHNYPYEDYVLAYKKILGTVMAITNLWSFKKIKEPIACSYSVSKKIKEKTKKEYEVIQNGIDTNVFNYTTTEEKMKKRNMLGISQEKKVFLYLGALIPRKNPLMVIDAFKSINKNEDNVLLIVGDGNLYEECKEYINGDNNIKLVGKVNNPIDYYKASDFYVASSYSEGLPMAVMEALSTGLPVILSDIDSHREVLSVDKTAGFLFSTGDYKDLARKMQDTITKNYTDMSLAASNIIINYLSAEIMTEKYQRIYQKNTNYNNKKGE